MDNEYLVESFGDFGWPLLYSQKVIMSRSIIDEALGTKAEELLSLGYVELEREAIAAFNRLKFLQNPNFEGSPILRKSGFLDKLPYQVHTNRELEFMEARRKPLAVFSVWLPEGQELIRRIVNSFNCSPISEKIVFRWLSWLPQGSQNGCHSLSVLIAFQNEEWRIDAYILLKSIGLSCGWNNTFEQMEGYLLGYDDWQMQTFMSAMHK